jgi:hypothetical protein
MAGMFDQFQRTPGTPIDKDAANKELRELLASRDYRLGRETLKSRYAGQPPTVLPPAQQRAIDREHELQESLKASEARRPNTDWQGIPTSAGGLLGKVQFIPEDLRQIAASRDRFLINQGLTEIQFMETSAWHKAYRDPDHVMHQPVMEGKRLMIEALDELDKQQK